MLLRYIEFNNLEVEFYKEDVFKVINLYFFLFSFQSSNTRSQKDEKEKNPAPSSDEPNDNDTSVMDRTWRLCQAQEQAKKTARPVCNRLQKKKQLILISWWLTFERRWKPPKRLSFVQRNPVVCTVPLAAWSMVVSGSLCVWTVPFDGLTHGGLTHDGLCIMAFLCA